MLTAESTSSFRNWQPEYAAHNIPTFPIKIIEGDKKPAIKGWQKVGLTGSGKLADKFADANALGFCPGRRNGITILDVDLSDQQSFG